MPVTSLWRIKGDVAAVVDYAKDDEKTIWDSSIFEAQGAEPDGQIFVDDLHDVADYVTRQTATIWRDQSGTVHRLVSGLNCDPDLAVEEMRAVKEKFGKPGGTVAYHGYQSFSEGEGPPDLIHEIGLETARRLWSKYQVVVTTHVDHQNHYHNHFVINTVSFMDGKKYYRSKADYRALRQVSDDLAREHGFYVIDRPNGNGRQHEVYDEKLTWRKIVKSDIDELLREARTDQHFYALLRNIGYDLKTSGKDISVRAPGMQRFIRMERNFGPEYSRDALRRRIAQNPVVFSRPGVSKTRSKQIRYHGSQYHTYRRHGKVRGFAAMYLRYCYMLGAIPERRYTTSRVSPALKADLIKLNRISAKTRFLCAHGIKTKEDLQAYADGVGGHIDLLTKQRASLRQQQRTVALRHDEAAYNRNKSEMAKISATCYELRKELRLCNEIMQENPEIAARVRQEERQETQTTQRRTPLR